MQSEIEKIIGKIKNLPTDKKTHHHKLVISLLTNAINALDRSDNHYSQLSKKKGDAILLHNEKITSKKPGEKSITQKVVAALKKKS